ncbi:MAG TPA: glycoside hydrolase family 130 protein [Terriglobia bacterium]|nr:glycoside hydrolase family 130 protein [Terriglobia bacterium]
MPNKSPAIGLLISAATVLVALELALPFGKWSRVQFAPILSPRGDGFESAGVFNPAVIEAGGKTIMLYRAQDTHGTSRIGYASSDDGVHFMTRRIPVLVPEAPYEKGGGVEDPRVVEISGRYWLTYTGYNNVDGVGPDKKDAQLCLANSTDLTHWKRQGVIMPAYKGKWNVGWTKSGAIVTERIHGKYWMYYLGDARNQGSQMGLANSDDLIHWSDATSEPVLKSRPGTFDSHVVEPGPPPIIRPDGIFLIYNGADDNLVYRTGWVLFDKNDPARVLARSDQPIFEPEQDWEKTGQVPNVVFVEGLIREPGRWLFYYGGADKYIGVARAPAADINPTR